MKGSEKEAGVGLCFIERDGDYNYKDEDHTYSSCRDKNDR